MMKKQHYMTHDEREQLEALHRAHVPVVEIARQLGFCRQTIYNELKVGMYEHERNGFIQHRYSAHKAGQRHKYAQTAKGRPLKIGNDRAYAEFLEKKMLSSGDKRKRFSPAAALAQANKEGFQTTICVSTLYSYITKKVFLHLRNRDLIEKSKRRKLGYHPVRRIAHPDLPSITNRPDYINSREEPGHFEMDLVISCAKGSGAVLTMTERTGKAEIIRKLKDKKAETVREALKEIKKQGVKFKSITTDNGSEFLQYEELQAVANCPIYYCHSYAAWEKGTNENHNRMIRRWFPKGTDFNKVSKTDIAACQEWMNNYPRKSLDWLTPNEFALEVAM
jgi:IS30 family transposase